MSWYVSESVKRSFENRIQKTLELIYQSGINFIEIGVFGSYARQDYKATSDIDFCVIVEKHPERSVSGNLRMDAKEIGADIVYATPAYFNNDTSHFAKNLRKDYRRIDAQRNIL